MSPHSRRGNCLVHVQRCCNMLHALIAKLAPPRIFLDANLSKSTFDRILRSIRCAASPHVIQDAAVVRTRVAKTSDWLKQIVIILELFAFQASSTKLVKMSEAPK